MTIIKNGCICGGDYYTTTEQCNNSECRSERKVTNDINKLWDKATDGTLKDEDIKIKITKDNNEETIEDINKEILKFNSNEIHEAQTNLGFPTNWEYFENELKTYSEEDALNLLNELKKEFEK